MSNKTTINAIALAGTTHNPKLRFVIHMDNDIEPIKLLSLNIVSDFVNNRYEFITISVVMARSAIYAIREYEDELYMKNERLRATIIYENNNKIQQVFEVVPYYDRIDENTDENKYESESLKSITFQLTQHKVKNLYQGLVTGIFKSSTMEDILKLMEDAVDSEMTFIEKPTNTRTYKQLHIEPTNIADIPTYLQNKFGIYNSPVNWYYRSFYNGEHLYVFPIYRINPVEIKDKVNDISKIVFYIENTAIYDDIESTYAKDNANDNVIRALGTDFFIKDKSDTNRRSMDNHVEGIDSDSIYKRPFKVGSDVTYSQDNTTRRYAEDVNVQYGKIVKPTNNFYKEREHLAKSNGMLATIVWRNSNQSYLYPNMLIEIIFGGKVYKGALSSYTSFFDYDLHRETTYLTIFITKEFPDDET